MAEGRKYTHTPAQIPKEDDGGDPGSMCAFSGGDRWLATCCGGDSCDGGGRICCEWPFQRRLVAKLRFQSVQTNVRSRHDRNKDEGVINYLQYRMKLRCRNRNGTRADFEQKSNGKAGLSLLLIDFKREKKVDVPSDECCVLLGEIGRRRRILYLGL
ncbi:hypothetical protein OROHE_008106 [Orobanche hederae]